MAFDWGSLAGAVASLGSAYLGSRNAKNAGRDATQSAQQSNDLTRYMFDRTRADYKPFQDTAVSANSRLSALLGLGGGASTAAPPQYVSVDSRGVPIANASLYDSDPTYRNAWDSVLNNHQRQYNTEYWGGSDRDWIQNEIAGRMPAPTQTANPGMSQQDAFAQFRATPGYQFGLDQGQRQIEASAAARGALNSGATLRRLQEHGRDYADSQGYRPYVSDLMQLSGNGQAMVGQLGSYGMNAAGQMGNNLMNASQARQNSTYQSNAAWQQGLQGAAGFFGDWYGNSYGNTGVKRYNNVKGDG